MGFKEFMQNLADWLFPTEEERKAMKEKQIERLKQDVKIATLKRQLHSAKPSGKSSVEDLFGETPISRWATSGKKKKAEDTLKW